MACSKMVIALVKDGGCMLAADLVRKGVDDWKWKLSVQQQKCCPVMTLVEDGGCIVELAVSCSRS